MFRVYATIFALSGAAGLIYESVWSHYLKLILGHAAYAQTLVLAIFMGGMAIGAWAAARFTSRISNLLFGYALVEGVVGVFALSFHGVFQFASGLLLDQVLPGLDPGLAAGTAKLVFATLLILPQSLLLGATFPLLTGGLIRTRPQEAGAMVALLYFANSIGAVAGVLLSGFWLIPKVGLPGASLTAGIINIALAIAVYGLAKRETGSYAPVAPKACADHSATSYVLWAAAITGAASFFYEIAWIRMLSMVLGSSTHAFELMLAAFILGLALGGLWIKRRIDTIADPRRFLGLVQLAMGALAVLTLPLYNWTFDLMGSVMSGIARTETGYAYFSLLSHGIALLVMLPASFCAGMTLPLLTLILMRGGKGERAIGQVYAANTLGSILGVLAAVHLVLPAVGLKGLLLFGTALDGALGAYLISTGLVAGGLWRRSGWTAAFCITWLVCLIGAHLDPRRMGGGVYRYGKPALDQKVEVLRWQDGKTASIGLVRNPSGLVVISTNGKPDASINMLPDAPAAPDEATQVLAGVLPMMLAPQTKKVAAIGLGSGMTTHSVLAFSQVAQIDTIEIEQAMVDSARFGYETIIPRAFRDPRSRIHIDDARAFFSGRGAKYDLIISEPSNPWVSGVASLFSAEFYRHVVRYLTDEGFFVQWIQLYETGVPIVASITQALDSVFSDYSIYATDNSNLLIVARAQGRMPQLSAENLKQAAVKEILERIGIHEFADFQERYLGNRSVWSPLMREVPVPMNSDFYPFVDLEAPRFRFTDTNAIHLLSIGMGGVPLLEGLGLKSHPSIRSARPQGANFEDGELAAHARAIRDHLIHGKQTELLVEVWQELATLYDSHDCKAAEKSQVFSLNRLARRLVTYLHPEELAAIWNHLAANGKCLAQNPALAQWLDLFRALSARNFTAATPIADALLNAWGSSLAGSVLQTLLIANLGGHVFAGDESGFAAAYRAYYLPAEREGRVDPSQALKVLVTQARDRAWRF